MKEQDCSIIIANFIRERSLAQKLTALADLEAEYSSPYSDRAVEPVQTLLHDVTSLHGDIKSVIDAEGHRFYYSDKCMTGA